MTGEGRTDAQVCFTYVQTLLMPPWQAGQVGCMDNRSSYHVDGVKEALASGGTRLESLPPYAPDVSPIEPCGSQFNAILRTKAARTRDLLYQVVAQAVALLT